MTYPKDYSTLMIGFIAAVLLGGAFGLATDSIKYGLIAFIVVLIIAIYDFITSAKPIYRWSKYEKAAYLLSIKHDEDKKELKMLKEKYEKGIISFELYEIEIQEFLYDKHIYQRITD